MSDTKDDSYSEDNLALSPLSFSNFLEAGSLSPFHATSIADTWNDDGFIFSLDGNCNEEPAAFSDGQIYQSGLSDPFFGPDTALDSSPQLDDTYGTANEVSNPSDINSTQNCTEDYFLNSTPLDMLYTTGYSSDELYASEYCNPAHIANVLPDPGYISNGYYNPSSLQSDFYALGNMLDKCHCPNYPQNGFYSVPNYGADELINCLGEIKELKGFIKQYTEEMHSMHEYMREVPAMHKELQMTKERCERIGQGLHKFSMDLLKYKGVWLFTSDW